MVSIRLLKDKPRALVAMNVQVLVCDIQFVGILSIVVTLSTKIKIKWALNIAALVFN